MYQRSLLFSLFLIGQSLSAPAPNPNPAPGGCIESCLNQRLNLPNFENVDFSRPGNWSEHNQFITDDGHGKAHQEHGQYVDDSKQIRFMRKNYSATYNVGSNGGEAANQIASRNSHDLSAMSMSEAHRHLADIQRMQQSIENLHRQAFERHDSGFAASHQRTREELSHSGSADSRDGNWSKQDTYSTDGGNGHVFVEQGQVVSGPRTTKYYNKNYTSSYVSKNAPDRAWQRSQDGDLEISESANYHQSMQETQDSQHHVAKEQLKDWNNQNRMSETGSRYSHSSHNEYESRTVHGNPHGLPVQRAGDDHYPRTDLSQQSGLTSYSQHNTGGSFQNHAQTQASHHNQQQHVRFDTIPSRHEETQHRERYSGGSHQLHDDFSQRQVSERVPNSQIGGQVHAFERHSSSSYSSQTHGTPTSTVPRYDNFYGARDNERRYMQHQGYDQTSSLRLDRVQDRQHFDPAFRTSTDQFVSGVIDFGGSSQKSVDCEQDAEFTSRPRAPIQSYRKYKRDTSRLMQQPQWDQDYSGIDYYAGDGLLNLDALHQTKNLDHESEHGELELIDVEEENANDVSDVEPIGEVDYEFVDVQKVPNERRAVPPKSVHSIQSTPDSASRERDPYQSKERSQGSDFEDNSEQKIQASGHKVKVSGGVEPVPVLSTEVTQDSSRPFTGVKSTFRGYARNPFPPRNMFHDSPMVQPFQPPFMPREENPLFTQPLGMTSFDDRKVMETSPIYHGGSLMPDHQRRPDWPPQINNFGDLTNSRGEPIAPLEDPSTPDQQHMTTVHPGNVPIGNPMGKFPVANPEHQENQMPSSIREMYPLHQYRSHLLNAQNNANENRLKIQPDVYSQHRVPLNREPSTADVEESSYLQSRAVEAYGGRGQYNHNHGRDIFMAARASPNSALPPVTGGVGDSWIVNDYNGPYETPGRSADYKEREMMQTTPPSFWTRLDYRIRNVYNKAKERARDIFSPSNGSM